jgi:hypothetical protein
MTYKLIHYINHKRSLLTVLFLLLLTGCSEKDTTSYLARVNNEYLNKDNLNLAPATILSGNEQDWEKRELIENWIVTELLYQEGLKHNLDKNPDIKNQIIQYQKQVIANQFLLFELGDHITAGDEEINEYYFENRDQFRVSQLTHKINRYTFDSLRNAENAYRALIRKNQEQIQEIKKTHLAESRFVNEGSVIPEVKSLLFSGTPPRITDPLPYGNLYHIFEIVETFPANAYFPISEVREKIRQEIGIMKYKEAYNALIKKLRKKSHVETFF